MIDTFFIVLRKIIVANLLLIFAFVIVYTPQTFSRHNTVNTAHAFVVTDPGHTAVSSVGYGIQGGLIIKETVLDGIAWAVAKSIVASLVSSLVEWINNGFEGSPAFITDLGNFLLKAADQAVGQFIEELGGDLSFLCSPFKLDIQIAIAIEYENQRENRPYEGCTLSGIVGNVEDFLDGDFGQEGGWDNWITITSQPEKYTPYGQELEAKKEMARRVAESKNQETTKANWGSGFMSGKICENVERPDGTSTLKCNIAKPGRIIADSLSKSLGASQDSLVTADEISEIIGALITTLANKAITGASGLLGLSPGTGYTYEGFDGGSFTAAAAGEGTGSSFNGLTELQNSLQLQEDYLAFANSSVPILTAYVNNSRNTEAQRQTARLALAQAQDVQQKAPGYIDQIQSLVTQFQTLEAEYNNANTSASRRTAILQAQQTIISNFSSLRVFTTIDLAGARQTWNTANF